MKKQTEVGTERILFPSAKRLLALATILALTIGFVGCQNGKCQSCLFRSRDKEKIDETQLGQVKNQDPPAPPTASPIASYDSFAGQDQRIANDSIRIEPTPVPAPENSLAANLPDPQRIPNTASGSDSTAAISSSQPTLDPLPDANNQARNFSTPEPQYRSVSPIVTDDSLGFAPSEQDHSSYLAPEAKDDLLALTAPLPPEMTGQPALEPTEQPSTTAALPPELTSQPATAIAREPNPDPNAIQPPAESATPDPASAAESADSAEYSPLMRDRYAIDSAYEMKKPVTLKGTARAQYVGNTGAVSSDSSATRRSANRPAARTYSASRPSSVAQPSSVASQAPTTIPGDAPTFVPNGQTSNIIPGMKLGVVDLSQRAK